MASESSPLRPMNAAERPDTVTAVRRSVVLPSPIAPFELFPQHTTLLFISRAQAWSPPSAICTAFDTFDTVVGED